LHPKQNNIQYYDHFLLPLNRLLVDQSSAMEVKTHHVNLNNIDQIIKDKENLRAKNAYLNYT
jgi:hypothetical protein